MDERRCPFKDCGVAIPADKFACYRHWFQLNPRQRAIVWAAYRDWQAGRIGTEGLRRIQDDVIKEVETGAQASRVPQPCDGCGAPVLWFRTAKTGSLCPIDAEPAADGNVVIRDGKAAVLTLGLFDDDGPRPGELRYKSHFATCPVADALRKARRGKKT